MKHSSELIVDADPAAILHVLSDLATYPAWNDLVSEAVPLEPDPADAGPAWRTTLRAQVGPFARSKQLRFVRDELDASGNERSVRFIRRELDGKDHAQWTMEASVRLSDDHSATGSRVALTLSYDGGLWVPALGAVLGGAIERATAKLPDYLESQ